MSRRHSFRGLIVCFVSCALAGLLVSAARASGPLGGHLCPINKHCQEKPPHWHNKRVCPKPICDPCTLQHHGYYHTCWRPSSIPADWSHCPVPPPGVLFSGTPPAPAMMAPAPAPPPRVLPESQVAPPPLSVEPAKPFPRVTPPPTIQLPPAKPEPTPAKKPLAYLP